MLCACHDLRKSGQNVVQVRASLGMLASPFWYVLLNCVVVESLTGPTGIMSDTAIVSSSLSDGDYGRCRMWACLTWGVCGARQACHLKGSGDMNDCKQ